MSRRRQRRLAELAAVKNGTAWPGSVIADDETARLFKVAETSQIEELNDLDQIDKLVAGDDGMIWLDLVNPTPERLDHVFEEFGASQLVREDAGPEFERPKIQEFPDSFFIVFYCLSSKENGRPEYHKLAILGGKNYLLTVRYARIAEIDDIVERWKRNAAKMSATGPSLLLYSLLDAIVDNYFVVIDEIGEQLNGLEEDVFENPNDESLKMVYALRQDLLHLRRITSPSRDVLNVLIRRDSAIVQTESVLYFQDIYDHLQRINETIDTYRDILIGAVDVYLGTVSFRLNSVMKKMTAIATVLMTLALISGIYGMNFKVMPELEWEYGYPTALAGMALLGAVMVYFFRRIDWL